MISDNVVPGPVDCLHDAEDGHAAEEPKSATDVGYYVDGRHRGRLHNLQGPLLVHKNLEEANGVQQGARSV